MDSAIKKKSIINIAAFLITRGASIIAYILAAPFFIKYAGEAQYGIVSIAFSFLGLGVIFDSAIGYVATQSIGRELARKNTLDHKKINSLMTIYTTTAIVFCAAAVMMVLLLVHASAEKKLYTYIILTIPLIAFSGIINAIFQTHNELIYINLSRLMIEISKALALVISAYFLASTDAVGPITLFSYCIRAVMDYSFTKKKFGVHLQLASWYSCKKFIKLASNGVTPLISVLLMLSISMSDKMLIKQLYGSEMVSYYSVAYDINTKVYLFVYGINSALFALILRNHANKINTLNLVKVGLIAVLIIITLYYVPIFFGSEKILSWIFDEDFANQAKNLTSLMAISSLIYLIGNVFENALTAMGKAKSILKVYVISVALYFLSLLLFTHFFGIQSFVFSYIALTSGLMIGFIWVYFNKNVALL